MLLGQLTRYVSIERLEKMELAPARAMTTGGTGVEETPGERVFHKVGIQYSEQVSAGAWSPYDVKDLPFRYTLHVFEHLYYLTLQQKA